MITGQRIVILSTQDWDALPTRKHRWSRQFAQQGNQVLYVEQQMHWAGWLVDVRRQFGRAFRWLRGPQAVEENLWVFTLPIVLPFFQMWGPINAINNWFLIAVLRWVLGRLGWHDIILWTYTPHSAELVGQLGDKLAIYECVDEFSASQGLVHGPTISALERRLLAKVDQVIVTAPALLASKTPLAKRVALVSNGADVDHFARASAPDAPIPADLAAIPGPRLGFIGWIQYWVDFDLLAALARHNPAWQVVLVGPLEPLARVDKVRGLPNVHFLGRKPYAQIPDYVAGFDVCLNPYVLDEVAEACSPIKLYEYMASGKPTVSVDMPDARQFDGLIPLTRTADGFVAAVEAALAAGPNGTGQHNRQQAARAHSWSARFAQVQALVEPLLAQAAQK